MPLMTAGNQSNAISRIHALLYELGINAGSCAFFQTAYAVWLAIEQPERLQLITKWLYSDVAAQYGTNWRAIEHNVRRVVNRAWATNPELLRKLTRYRLYSRPAPTEFIAILAAHVAREMNSER